jgi:DNA-binding transcriptional ArsR family regulator
MSLEDGRQEDGRQMDGRRVDGRRENRQATLELRATAHPVRLRVLSMLTGAAMTAAEVARELKLTHANASYHLRQLLAAGTIQVAGEERIRGGLAKRYRYDLERDIKPNGAPSADPADLRRRQQLYAAVAHELRRRASHVRPSKGRLHLTDAELWVAPELWHELKNVVDQLCERLHRGARPPHTEGTILVNATFAMFEMNP